MKKCLIILFFLSVHGWCVAQVQEQVSPAERKQQTIVTEPVTLYKGFFRTGLATWYNVIDKIFLDSKKQSQPGNIWGSAFSFSLYGQYGISDRLMAEVLIPYTRDDIYQSVVYEVPLDFNEEYIYPRKWKTQANGLGDVDLTLAYQLLQETVSRPALAVFVTTTFPTGEKNVVDNDDDDINTFSRPTGQGEFALNTVLRLRQVKYPFSYSVSASYKYRTESTKVITVGQPAVKYRNGNLIDVTGSFNFHVNDWIAFKNIVDVVQVGQDTQDGEKIGEKGWLLQYLPGISFQLKRLRFDQGVMIPVKGDNVAADPGYILIVQYTF
ncbi:MAG: transporter [Cyclobacteriaceae bacterium]